MTLSWPLFRLGALKTLVVRGGSIFFDLLWLRPLVRTSLFLTFLANGAWLHLLQKTNNKQLNNSNLFTTFHLKKPPILFSTIQNSTFCKLLQTITSHRQTPIANHIQAKQKSVKKAQQTSKQILLILWRVCLLTVLRREFFGKKCRCSDGRLGVALLAPVNCRKLLPADCGQWNKTVLSLRVRKLPCSNKKGSNYRQTMFAQT